jgi:alpha/beta superfamily hydrolase
MKINDDTQMADFRSLCALHGDYVTGIGEIVDHPPFSPSLS